MVKKKAKKKVASKVSKTLIVPFSENLKSSNQNVDTWYFYDDSSKPVHKTKEIFKTSQKIIAYPYSYSKIHGVKPKKIQTIEFIGWDKIGDIPKEFNNKKGRLGLNGRNIKTLMRPLYRKYPKFDKLIIVKNGGNRFNKKTIRLSWKDLLPLINDIRKETNFSKTTIRNLSINSLASLSNQFTKVNRSAKKGEISRFLKRFDNVDNLTKEDVSLLSKLVSTIPNGSISVTTNFIEAKNKINIAYIDDVIKKCKKLLSAKRKNEKDWQEFLSDYGWILNSLFPYEVILYKKEAYLGGKKMEDSEGRIVDFLVQNGFKDNFSLIEIKTHITKLLKPKAYRKPDAYSMDDEFSGAISQVIDQKSTFVKEMGKGNNIHDPKTILIIGQKSTLTNSQKNCFELIRNNQKHVDIVTFDELLQKLEGLSAILKSKKS